MYNNLIKRKIVSSIADWIDTPDIIILIGHRQVGKTCLLYIVRDYLINQKGISQNQIRFIDLENREFISLLNAGVQPLIDWLELDGVNTNSPYYLLIDEIQYLKDPSNILKLLHDHFPNCKVISTGSSTLEIKLKFSDSLAGRKKVFEIYPLSFSEYLIFRGKTILGEKLSATSFRNTNIHDLLPFMTKKEELLREYEYYVRFGGFPRVVLEQREDRKRDILLELYDSYVKKDIKELAEIRNIEGFNNLI
ncbi:MAG: ATP-binding protein, partial [Nitrospinota bacterium]